MKIFEEEWKECENCGVMLLKSDDTCFICGARPIENEGYICDPNHPAAVMRRLEEPLARHVAYSH